MKKLFAILFSFQLILQPVALAQSASDSPSIDAYRVSGNGSRGGYDFYIKQLMMLGSGIVGTNTLTGKFDEHWFTVSPYVFGAGAVVLLISEIDGALKKNKFHEKKMKELELDQSKLDQMYETGKVDKAVANTQVEAVDKMIQEEDDNIEFLKSRKKWMDAVSVVYWSAVALTAIEIIFYVIPNDLTPYDIDFLDYGPPGKKTGFKINNAGLGKTLKSVLYLTYAASPLLVNDVANNQGKGLIGAATTMGGAALASVVLGSGMKAGISKMQNMLDQFDDKVSNILQKAMDTPFTRAATFAVFAGLATTVSQGLKDRMEIAEANKAKLNKLKADLLGVTATNTVATGDVPDVNTSGQNLETNGPSRGKIGEIKKYDRPKICAGQCMGNLKTKKIDFGKVQIPSVIQKSISDSMGMATAFDNDDMGKADFFAGELSANAAKVKGTAEELMKKVNETAKKHGQKEFDFNKAVAAQAGTFNQAALSSASAAGMGPGPGEGTELAPTEVAKDIVPEVASVAKPAADTPAAALDPLAGIGGDSTEVQNLDTAGETAAADSLDNYETNVQDINKAPEVSIFKQLSNRYILNYTKIFDRKKEPQPESAPAKQ